MDLPPEVLGNVFRHLPTVRDVGQWRRVAGRYNQVGMDPGFVREWVLTHFHSTEQIPDELYRDMKFPPLYRNPIMAQWLSRHGFEVGIVYHLKILVDGLSGGTIGSVEVGILARMLKWLTGNLIGSHTGVLSRMGDLGESAVRASDASMAYEL